MLISAPLFVACSTNWVGSSETGRQLSTNHPLVGKIWDIQNQRFINEAELLASAIDTNYLLLGEQHDNRVHHERQAWFIDRLKEKQLDIGVSFEMIDNEQYKLMQSGTYNTAEELIAILNKIPSFWHYEHRYQNLFDRVIQAGYPIYAANLNRKTLMKLMRGNDQQIPSDINKIIKQTQLTTEQQQALEQEIIDSHCGHIKQTMAKHMVIGQRIRDAVMAQSLLKQKHSIKVLMAGSGHARNDRGVPLYLRSQVPEAKTLSIAMIEVTDDVEATDLYSERWGGQELPFNYIWFSPRVDRGDPCSSFKK